MSSLQFIKWHWNALSCHLQLHCCLLTVELHRRELPSSHKSTTRKISMTMMTTRMVGIMSKRRNSMLKNVRISLREGEKEDKIKIREDTTAKILVMWELICQVQEKGQGKICWKGLSISKQAPNRFQSKLLIWQIWYLSQSKCVCTIESLSLVSCMNRDATGFVKMVDWNLQWTKLYLLYYLLWHAIFPRWCCHSFYRCSSKRKLSQS